MVLVLHQILLHVSVDLHLSSIQKQILVLVQEHLKIHTLVVLDYVFHVLLLLKMELDWPIVLIELVSVKKHILSLKMQGNLHVNVLVTLFS
jgi:hypothetical protein